MQVQSERLLTVATNPMMRDLGQDPKLEIVAEALRHETSVTLALRGTSMLPALWPGDLLTVDAVINDELVVGDLVFVVRGGRSFVHRLVRRLEVDAGSWWITQGDAILHEDTPLRTSQVLGRVVHIRRRGLNLFPARNPSNTHRTFAWLLRRSARIRGIVLRIYLFRLSLAEIGLLEASRNLIGPTRGNLPLQSSRAFHS